MATPEDQLGRCRLVDSVFIGASNELGAFKSGVTAFGLSGAIAFGGIMSLVVAGAFAVFSPTVRTSTPSTM